MEMAVRDADTGPASGANTTSLGEAHRQRCDKPALKQPSFRNMVIVDSKKKR